MNPPKPPGVEGVVGVNGAKKRTEDQHENLEHRLLAILYLKPELSALAQELLGAYSIAQSPSEDLLNILAVFADREFQDQSLEALRRELEQTCARLRDLQVAKHGASLEQQMRDAELVGDSAKISELLAQFTHMTKR